MKRKLSSYKNSDLRRIRSKIIEKRIKQEIKEENYSFLDALTDVVKIRTGAAFVYPLKISKLRRKR